MKKSALLVSLVSLCGGVALAQGSSRVGPFQHPAPLDLAPAPATTIASTLQAAPASFESGGHAMSSEASQNHPLREIVMQTWGKPTDGLVQHDFRLTREERLKMREQLRNSTVFEPAGITKTASH